MKNQLILLLLLITATAASAQSEADRKAILGILDRQTRDWNAGNIAAFMNGYWESDSLMFVGKNGVTYGYRSTYEGYLKRYPDRATMGTLQFTILHLNFPGPDVAFVVGKWNLTRPEKGDVGGHYTLLWRRIGGRWVIVCDHTS
ncbi:nuclear transport factor 2 family protein [Telluribacter sp.]|jgi:ketosteroid isomerase-like protein|uniref:YybH family protein n=1 Tax=Telluribacter sp. TaxID=1978767 RepID=UPI002E119F5A|nr:nuclear transport factor 2 family protein [Telluribacter sp.]